MEDHRVLNGKAAVGSEDLLIVRGAVLARVGDAPGLHGGSGFVEMPAGSLGAGEGDAVQRIQMEEQVHHRGGDEIDILHRLAQGRDPGGQAVHLGGIFRQDEELFPRPGQGQQGRAAFVAVGGELPGVVQRIGVVEHQRFRVGRGCLLCRTARQQKRRGGERF